MDYRLGSTDWIPALGNVEGLERIAVIGAGAVANAGAVAKLQQIVPGARVDGMPGEGWNKEVEETAVEWLYRLRPQLVLLGLGMPLQEQVLARRLATLPPAVYCTVGGAIEQIAGVQKLAPRWIGRLGLEWAWRLHASPPAGGLPGLRRALGAAGAAAAPASAPAAALGLPAARGQNFWSSSGPKPLPRSPAEKAREPVREPAEVSAAQEVAEVAADIRDEGLDPEMAADHVAAVPVVEVALEGGIRNDAHATARRRRAWFRRRRAGG